MDVLSKLGDIDNRILYIILIPVSYTHLFHGKTGPLSRLDFVRDERGNILGFDNTGNRAFNVRFHFKSEAV